MPDKGIRGRPQQRASPATELIHSSVNALEDGVIVQVEISSQFDPSIDAMARYPCRAAVLALDEDNRAALYPSFVIPNQRHTTVKVSVVAVPKEATTESLNLIFSAFDVRGRDRPRRR